GPEPHRACRRHADRARRLDRGAGREHRRRSSGAAARTRPGGRGARVTPSTGTVARRVPWTAYACLGASMAVVGSYVGLSKVLVAVFPVFLLAWLRFGISAIAMTTWLRGPAGSSPLAPRDRRLLFVES